MLISRWGMKFIFQRHKIFWGDWQQVKNAVSGLILFALALWLNISAARYATGAASAAVADLVLSNTPVFNVDLVVNDLALVFIGFVLALLVFNPRRLPFIAKSVALFMVVRSIFITLTHIGPFPTRSYIDLSDWLSFANTGADFFFSGHTGSAFLLALIFWKNNLVRYICLATSVLFGAAMLLGHLHYSIDVVGAFFITYAIYKISECWFKKDKEIFDKVEG